MSALNRTLAATLTAATLMAPAAVAVTVAPVAAADPASACAALHPKSPTAQELCRKRLESREETRTSRTPGSFVTRVVPTESPLDRETRLQERRAERNRNRILTIGGILAVLAVVGGAVAWTRRQGTTPAPAHAAGTVPSQPAAQQWTPQPEQPTYEYPAYAEQSAQTPPMPDYGTYAAQPDYSDRGFADASQSNPDAEPSPPHGGGRFDDMI